MPQHYNQGSVTLSTTVVLPALNKRTRKKRPHFPTSIRLEAEVSTIANHNTKIRAAIQPEDLSLYNVRYLHVRVGQGSWGAVPLSDSRHAGWAGLHSLLCWLPTASCPSADISMHQTNPSSTHEKCYRMLSYPSTFYNVVWIGFAMTVHCKGADALHHRKRKISKTIKLGNAGYNPPASKYPFLEVGENAEIRVIVC